MKNPLSSKYSEEKNQALVKAALEGDRQALDSLVRLHQPFIYNIAWKMTHDPNDAMDLTQETLLKVITKLSQFNFKSSFRTWLYRIVINEFLQGKRRKGEDQFSTFTDYGERLDAIPNADLTIEEEIMLKELAREMQVRCLSGMLMCLNREQRLIYILGEVFGVDHKLGAEIFEISPPNFRVKLHRSRKDLQNYMTDKCGLVNKSNPCRCPKKAKSLRKMGLLDEKNMLFNIETKTRIADYVEKEHDRIRESIEDRIVELYRDHPAKDVFSKETILTTILSNKELMKQLHFK
ncbi:MAG: RNA polymerase sigma factor [Bacteroidota bacterium]